MTHRHTVGTPRNRVLLCLKRHILGSLHHKLASFQLCDLNWDNRKEKKGTFSNLKQSFPCRRNLQEIWTTVVSMGSICPTLARDSHIEQLVLKLFFSSPFPLLSFSFPLSFFLLLSPFLPFLPSLSEINIFCFHITLLLGYFSAQTHGASLPWTEPSEINSQSKHFLLLNYFCWLFYHTKSSEYLVPSEDQKSWDTALRYLR